MRLIKVLECFMVIVIIALVIVTATAKSPKSLPVEFKAESLGQLEFAEAHGYLCQRQAGEYFCAVRRR